MSDFAGLFPRFVNMRVTALIVTCNRREMLSALIEDLLSQSRRPDGIIVVDNGSEDGTVAHVKEQFPSVRLVEREQNDGHMPGFEIGVKTFFEQDYDAALAIDDDARLKNDTLECLLQAIESHDGLENSAIWCANVTPDAQYFTEPVCLKVGNEWKIYEEFLPEVQRKVFESLGGANIGFYIPRAVVQKAGLPWGILTFNGEEEYKYRIKQAGFKLYYCLSSIIYHKRHEYSKIKFMGKTRFVSKAEPWRAYYELRNRIFIDRVHKRRTLLKSLVIGVMDSVMRLYATKQKISTAIYISRAVFDGLLGRMGLRVKIPRPIQSE